MMTQLRKVVPTNEAHIVGNSRRIISYWRELVWWMNGAVYFAWPEWIPILWVSIQKLPLSIFDLQLDWYKCYDSGKIPFEVDVTAYFIISNPEITAQKVENISELRNQLNETLKWVVRKILASKNIISIIEARLEIKEEFYREVFGAVKSWGIKLQNLEFMDIRDADNSKVILSYMMEKRSTIESEAQIKNAENQKIIKIFWSIEKVLEKDRELKLKEEELNKREIEIIKRENIIYKKNFGKIWDNLWNKENKESILFS